MRPAHLNPIVIGTKAPFPSELTEFTDKHEYQPTGPLSLRERVGVRVNIYPLSFLRRYTA